MTRKTEPVADTGESTPRPSDESALPVRATDPVTDPLQAEAVRQSGVRTRFDAGRYRRKQDT